MNTCDCDSMTASLVAALKRYIKVFTACDVQQWNLLGSKGNWSKGKLCHTLMRLDLKKVRGWWCELFEFVTDAMSVPIVSSTATLKLLVIIIFHVYLVRSCQIRYYLPPFTEIFTSLSKAILLKQHSSYTATTSR